MISGFINLLKPPGPTSHDMVGLARRLLGIKRIGHSGTLDPLASGVLVLAVGKATRLIPYLEESKTYRAEITFGTTTDTMDAAGNITSKCSPSIQQEELVTILSNFVGPIWQIPPMVSAVKWEGQRLYQLARKGIEVERKARPVMVHDLSAVAFWDHGPCYKLLMDCTCSSGTYIRTLASDIGQAIGCGAYLSFLLRLQNGPFSVKDSLLPEELQTAVMESDTTTWLCPPDRGLQHMARITLDGAGEKRFSHGNYALTEQTSEICNAMTVRTYDMKQEFLGLGRIEKTSLGCTVHPVIVMK